MKILCCGDVHIGRRSSRLPDPVDGRSVSCAACWERVVEHALAERVDVVALSGDVVDRENRFYEATGPLERGVRRLAEAGAVTVAVAGNHDHDVLPRLVEGFDPESFRFLGGGGRWERTTVRRGGEALHVVGWSFPRGEVRESPVAGLEAAPDDGTPVLGLLHADLDQPGSRYAPVSLAELRAAPVHFWLLGHVHAPRLHEADGAPPVLYPGSPQAMDPGETGAHGVWILETEPGRRFRARRVPLSSVRYDGLDVDVDGAGEPEEFDRRVTAAMRAHLVAAAADAGALRHLCCRLRIVGRTPLHRGLAGRAARLCADIELDDGGVTARVERVELLTRPARDLAELARGADAVGTLAALLLALEGAGGVVGPEAGTAGPGIGTTRPDTGAAGPEARAAGPGAGAGAAGSEARAAYTGLLREAVAAVADVHGARPYLAIAGDGLDPTGLAQRALVRQASLLLDELLAQKEGA